MDSFSSFHPVVNFIYFICLFGLSLRFRNPYVIGIVLVTMLFYYGILAGVKGIVSVGKAGVFLALFSFIINPLFNHRGICILFYLGNTPITKESVIYSIVTAGYLVSMLFLFACFQKVMSADKITVLFAKISPKFALTFSMALSLIPKLSKDYKEIRRAQKGIGKSRKGSAVSSLIGIGLEDSIDRADSMAARGYLLKGKRTHVIPKMNWQDIRLLCVEILMFVFLLFI
ncbi:MAG: hypothetical protein J6I65_02810, partial [Lachnospiraceae bacterium]|nr:hypothetical protein [Lachnospiraceae bacterium]